jgi:uncharacterized SAM-binding protein YcdF (DUF218 family)
MKKFLFTSTFIVGCLCVLGATATTIAFGFTVGNVIGLIAGAFFIGLYFVYPKLSARLRKWLKISLFCVALFMSIMIVFIGIKGAKDTTTFNEDVVLVLGCGIRGETLLPTLQRRLDTCLDYLQHNPTALIVVSGGKGYNESIPEAEAMKHYLVLKGIDPAQISMEDQSRNTNQNMQFSKRLLDNYFPSGCTTVCITSNYHAYRASVLAARYDLKTTSYNAETAWYLYPSAFCREVLSICKMWIMTG